MFSPLYQCVACNQPVFLDAPLNSYVPAFKLGVTGACERCLLCDTIHSRDIHFLTMNLETYYEQKSWDLPT